MSRVVAQFDPSTQAGAFQAGAVNRCSALLVMNESPNFLQFDFGGAGGRMIIQPWFNLVIRLPEPIQTVNWTVVASLQSGGAPASIVYVVGYDPKEAVSDSLTGPLFRQSNVGNAAAVGSATSSVQNDGAALGTTVVEATPTGGGSSQLLLTNQGAATLGGGNVKISATGVFTLPASAVPVASLGAGALPAGVTLPAGQVTGALPASQVGSGYPAANIAAGTLVSGVAHTTITSDGGAITSTGSGNLAATNLFLNGNLNATAVSSGCELGSTSATNTPYVDFHSSGNNIDYDARIIASGGNASIGQGALSLYAANGLTMVNGPLNPKNGGSLTGVHLISGSGSATVNHGLSVTPDCAVVNTDNGSNSTTFGSGSYTSSTVYIYEFNPQLWVGLVYKA